jgi:hypothetical protein
VTPIQLHTQPCNAYVTERERDQKEGRKEGRKERKKVYALYEYIIDREIDVYIKHRERYIYICMELYGPVLWTGSLFSHVAHHAVNTPYVFTISTLVGVNRGRQKTKTLFLQEISVSSKRSSRWFGLVSPGSCKRRS